MTTSPKHQSARRDRIDPRDAATLATWARKLDASAEQIRDAVKAVGDHPEDVEMYLKGSRSASNQERVAAAFRKH